MTTESCNFLGFADVPVLAELATEIASCSAKGKDAGSRVKMIEGFLFDRIDAKTGAFAVGVENHLAVFDLANKAEASILLLQTALSGA